MSAARAEPPPPPSPPSPPEPPARPRSHRILLALAAALLGLSLIGYAERLWWIFDIFSHFRLHLAVAGAVLALYTLVARAWPALAVCAVGFALNSWPLASLLGGAPAQQPAALQVVSFNVLQTSQRGRTLTWLEGLEADLVGLQEVDASWMEATAVLSRWPHQIARPRNDLLGLGLLSRWPITRHGHLSGGDHPADAVLWAEIAAPDGPLEVFVAHPLPPMGAVAWARRRALIAALAEAVERAGPRVVVLADLNAAPWSAAVAPLREQGLRHGRVGRGHQGSWPAAWPALAVPIDHVLVRGFEVVSHQLGPALGSDHLPVLAGLAPAQGAGAP